MGRPSLLPGGWTPRAQRTLRRHAEAGLSARQAAARMGITKNAAIARANRTDVQFDPDPELLSALARKAGLASAAARAARKASAHG